MNLILTNRGADLASSGFVTGNYPSIVKVKVGDGGGVDVVHDATALDIINPVFETDIVAGIRENDVITMMFTVPFDVGGFVVREIGVYTENDELIAVSDRVNWEKKSMDEDPTEVNVHMKLTMSATQGMGIVFSNDDIYASKKALAETNNTIILVAKNIREEIEVYKESVKQSVIDDTFHATVKGTVTTDGRMNLVRMKDVNLEVALGLEVGDVIKISSESIGSQLTPSTVAGNVNPPFRHMCTFKNDVYAVVHGGDEDTRGVWKQTNGKGVWTRVLDETLSKPSMTSDGEYLYLTRENGRVQRVNRVVLVEGKDKTPVLDNEGRPTYEQIPRLDGEGNQVYEQVPILDEDGNQVYEQIPVLDNEGNQVYEQIPVLDGEGNPTYEQVPVLDGEGNPTYEQVPVLDGEGNQVYEQIPVLDENNEFVYKYTLLLDVLNAPIFGEMTIIDGTNPEHPDYPDAVDEVIIYKSPLLNNYSTNIVRALKPDGTVNEVKLDYVEGTGYVMDSTFIPPIIEDEVNTLYNYEPVLIHDGVYYKEYRYKIVSKKKTYIDGDPIFTNGDPITVDGNQIFIDDLDEPIFMDGDPLFMGGDPIYDNGDQIFTPAIQEVLGNDLDFNRLSDLTNVVRRFSAITYNPVDRYLYTAVHGGLIYRVDRDTGNEIVNSVVARDWNSIIFHPTDGNIYAAEWNGLIYTKFGADYEDIGIIGKRFYNQLFTIGESLAVTMRDDSPYRISLTSKTLTKMNNLTPTTLDFVGGAVTLRGITYFASDKGIFTADTGSSEIIRTVSMLGNDEIVDFGKGNVYNLKTGEILVNVEGSGWKDNTNLKLATSIDLEDVTISRVNKYYHRASDEEIEEGIVDFRFVTPKGLSVFKKEVDSAVAVATQPGEYRDFAMRNPKGRWMFCDGRELRRDLYPGLFEAIGLEYTKTITTARGIVLSIENPNRRDMDNFYRENISRISDIPNIKSPHGNTPTPIMNPLALMDNMFRDACTHNGSIYAVAHNGTVNNRGVWKIDMNGTMTRVVDIALSYPAIESDGNNVYITSGNTPIRKLNLDTNTLDNVNTIGRARFGLAYDKKNNKMYTAVYGNHIWEINLKTGVETQLTRTARNWSSICVNNGVIYASVMSNLIYRGEMVTVGVNTYFDTVDIGVPTNRNYNSIKPYNNGLIVTVQNTAPQYIDIGKKTINPIIHDRNMENVQWLGVVLTTPDGMLLQITRTGVYIQTEVLVEWKDVNNAIKQITFTEIDKVNKEIIRLDNLNLFRIPDRRGLFPRTLDNGKGTDSDKNRTLGSVQGDAIRNITGRLQGLLAHMGTRSFTGVFNFAGNVASSKIFNSGGEPNSIVNFDASRQVPTAPENRPINITVYTCISY